jgi:glycosidase
MSVLTMNRRMIHLRSSMCALGQGMLVPLASTDSVVAYLREAGDSQVLVLANLTSKPVSGAALWSRRGALPSGRWALRNVLGGPDGAELHVDAKGQLQNFTPLPSLAPLEGYVFELRRVRD